jgi:hypothetical protein
MEVRRIVVGIAIDAVLLIVLLKTVAQKEIDFWTAALVGLVASTATTILANKLMSAVGVAGIIVAAPVAAVLLGMGLVWAYGVKIKRACLAGSIFAAVHLAYVTLVSWLWYYQ